MSSPDAYDWFGRRLVIMPDHIHIIAHMGIHAIRLGQWIKALKAVTGGAVRRAGKPDASSPNVGDTLAQSDTALWASKLVRRQWRWQTGFHDHKFRSAESEARKWEYVCLNPVRAGLVSRPEEWPFCGEIVYKAEGPILIRGTPPLLERGLLIGKDGSPIAVTAAGPQHARRVEGPVPAPGVSV
jgi:REP element-mobilizing transposase RayT